MLLVTAASGLSAEKLKVASLHPLMSDLARQVAGDKAQVVQIIDDGASPHSFEPSPKKLLKAKGARLYLASGKNMETYLGKLRSTLGSKARVVEVGRTIPSLRISARDSQYVCCPTHAHGAIDPHWWHNVSNMQKAARVVAKELGKEDPANAAAYKANAAAYSKRLGSLNAWVKRELSKVPRKNRILVTAHASFGYFCKAYGFRSLPVKGLTAQQKPSATYQALAISEIKKHKVKAIFPERRANPKALQTITKETGTKLGDPLVADGASNYEQMVRGNVVSITKALR